MARFYGVAGEFSQPGEAGRMERFQTGESESGNGASSGPEFRFEDAVIQKLSAEIIRRARLLKTDLENAAGECLDLGSEAAYLRVIKVLTLRLSALYTAYDEYLDAVLKSGSSPVKCRPSCPSCCSHYVTSVEPLELLYLDHHLKARSDYSDFIVRLYERTTAYRRVFKSSEGELAEDRALHRYFMLNRACPFLTKSGDCGVREFRPVSCRMFFSYSDPKWCHGRQILNAKNQNFHVGMPDEAEVLLAEASALLASKKISEHLFDGLLQVNELFGKYPSSPTS